MRTGRTITALMVSVVIGSSPITATAGAPSKPQFGYFLTKIQLVASVRQKLAACPDPADDQLLPAVETEWSIEAEPAADTMAYVNVDASNGFLAKRSTALKLRPDGTLESFDSETSGQGGAVLSAILKVASTVLLPSVSVGAAGVGMQWFSTVKKDRKPPPSFRVCKPEVVAKFATIASWSKQIGALEDKVLKGEATAADVQLLERRKTQRANARESLVLTSDPNVIPLATTTQAVDAKVTVKPLDFSKWFDPAETAAGAFDPAMLVGHSGFEVRIHSDTSPFPGDGTVLERRQKASPRLVYRRPVRAAVSAEPCQTIADDVCTKSPEPEYAAASVSTDIPVPQFSGLYSLSTGRGGLFGNRQASAKFDEYGTPIEISYGSDGGAADVASTITAAGDAVTTLRDGELTALERQIKLEEARKKLRDLRATPAAE